jgi:hypothetical protein
MKKIYFFIMSLFVFSSVMALFSCSGDAGVSKKEDKMTDKLSVMATGTYAMSSGELIVFTEDNIESYNAKTKRIALKTLGCDDIFRRAGENFRLAFYLGEEFLFEALLAGEYPDAVYDEPVFVASCGDEFVLDKYFLFDGYPATGKDGFPERIPGWGRFIQYMSDAGKLEDTADPVIPAVPTNPDRIIKAFAGDDIKSFNVTTGEIVFVNLTVDDIYERRAGFSSAVSFYLGEQLLFESPVVHPTDSRTYNDLVFTYYENKFYLSDGYGGQNEEDLKIREENALKRKAKWDAFIKYLTDAGKSVN